MNRDQIEDLLMRLTQKAGSTRHDDPRFSAGVTWAISEVDKRFAEIEHEAEQRRLESRSQMHRELWGPVAAPAP